MKLKHNKGITLVSLVITIIILLILASITLSTLKGESGILTNAQDAKTKTGEAEIAEKIKLSYITAMLKADNNEDVNIEVLEDKLIENVGEDIQIEKNGTDGISLPWSITADGTIFELLENGNVEIAEVEEEVPEGKVARIGTTYYETLQSAITDAPESTETEVVLLTDVTETVQVASGKNIKLDLNGNTVSTDSSNYAAITNNGILTMINEGTIISQNSSAIQNYSGTLVIDGDFVFDSKSTQWATLHNSPDSNAKLTISGGNIDLTAGAETLSAIENWGILDITGGTLNATNCCGILNNGYQNANATTTINGNVNITANKAGINLYYGTVSITGATVKSTTDKVINTDHGQIIINNGAKIEGQTDGIACIVVSAATLTVNGGTISSPNSIAIDITNTGNATINGGTITSTAVTPSLSQIVPTIKNIQGCTLTITGGTIKNTAESGNLVISNQGTTEISGGTIIGTDFFTIANHSSGTLTISAGTITSSADTTYSTIYHVSGTLTMTGGTVKNSSTASTAYEIIANTTSTVTINEDIQSSLRIYTTALT